MTRATPIQLGVVIADAEAPRVAFDGSDRLRVEFLDYTGTERVLVFEGVYGFRWQYADAELLEGEPHDGAAVLHDSEWVAELRRQGAVADSEQVEHYRLNFNATGSLEVAAAGWALG